MHIYIKNFILLTEDTVCFFYDEQSG